MLLGGVNAVGIFGISNVGLTLFRIHLLHFENGRLYLVLLVMVLVLLVPLL
jgi:hypothetical protein